MAKYLFQASYTAEGAKGLIEDGGTKRRKAVKKFVESFGGTMEAFYFAFGKDDVYAVVDVPDHVSAAAASLAIASSGVVSIKTTVLLAPEEIDKAAKKAVGYRPPGN
jgi:uncharacterized protein with GYD domain